MEARSTPTIEFIPLRDAPPSKILSLMNNPLVRRHMPLAKDFFDMRAYQAFIEEKESLWKRDGYGPSAILINGTFAGWGGLQYESGDAEIALILHPNFWGFGKRIYQEIISCAFSQLNLSSVTALLPPSRTKLKSLAQLHFKRDGELIVNGELFYRFRLTKPSS